MVLSGEAGSNEVRTDVLAGRQIGIEHGAYRRKEVPNDDVVFTGGRADTNVTTVAQDAPAFLRHGNRVRKMMIDLRHEYEIDTAIRQRKLFRRSPLEFDHPGRGF